MQSVRLCDGLYKLVDDHAVHSMLVIVELLQLPDEPPNVMQINAERERM